MDLQRRSVLIVAGTSISTAGCLSGRDDTAPQTDDGESNDTADEEVTVQVQSHPEFGEILVGPDGMTLYNFDMDTQGASESSCEGGCLDSWPVLTAEGTPRAGTDVTAEVTAFERDDGTMQVVANGWPLYYFVDDDDPGDTAGQGANDVWWVLRPDGTPIREGDDTGNGENEETESGNGGDDGPGGAYSYGSDQK